MLGVGEVDVEGAEATEENRHLGSGQREEIGPIDQEIGSKALMALLDVIAESVSGGFQNGEGTHVGLFLRGIHAPRREGNLHRVATFLRSRLDGRTTSENDQIGERDFLSAGRRRIELLLDPLKRLKHLGEFRGLVDFPILLRSQAEARPIGAATLVTATESRRRGPGGGNEFRDRETGAEDLGFQTLDFGIPDQRVIHRGDRILPDQHFRGDIRTEITRSRAHVAVGELEPCAGKSIGELIGMLEEAA